MLAFIVRFILPIICFVAAIYYHYWPKPATKEDLYLIVGFVFLYCLGFRVTGERN